MLKKYVPYIAMLVVGVVIGLLCRPNHIREVTKMVQTDTLVRVDTVVVEKPLLVHISSKDTLYVTMRDTTRINDTLYMALPSESKTYKGEDYLAIVSGFQPKLDHIEVYPRTTTITNTETITQSVIKRNYLALGLEVNYTDTPYIPIYLQYSHLLHKNVEMYAKLYYNIPQKMYGFGLGARVAIGW